MAHVNVTIAERTYRMACEDGQEEHLLGLAEQVNGHIEALRGNFGDVGDMRLVIMASLVLADETHEAQRQSKLAEAEAEVLRERRAAMIGTFETAQNRMAEALIDTATRVESLAAALLAGDMDAAGDTPAEDAPADVGKDAAAPPDSSAS